MWSEGDVFDDRLAWIECYGIHPKCWSTDNVRKIGEKWGPVLCIENRVHNLHNLTFARMLIRTKAQNKLYARIRILFENKSCDVWVKEGPNCCGKANQLACVNSRMSHPMNVEEDFLQDADVWPENERAINTSGVEVSENGRRKMHGLNAITVSQSRCVEQTCLIEREQNNKFDLVGADIVSRDVVIPDTTLKNKETSFDAPEDVEISDIDRNISNYHSRDVYNLVCNLDNCSLQVWNLDDHRGKKSLEEYHSGAEMSESDRRKSYGSDRDALGLPCGGKYSMSGYGENSIATTESVHKMKRIRMKENHFKTQEGEKDRNKTNDLYVHNRSKIQSVMILEPLRKLTEFSDHRIKEQHKMICWEGNSSSTTGAAQSDHRKKEQHKKITDILDAKANFTELEMSENSDHRSDILKMLNIHENSIQGSDTAVIAILDGGNVAVVVDDSHEPKVTRCADVDRKTKEVINDDFFHSLEIVEPVLCDMLNRPVGFVGNDWYDPVLVNETSGWLLSMFDSEPISDICPDEVVGREMVTPIQVTLDVRPQRKNLRGRPKKSFNHMPDLAPSPLSARIKEAQNTWDIAKILDISSS